MFYHQIISNVSDTCNIKKKLKTSPINLCGLCLSPKGPNNSIKTGNEITKTENIITLTHDDQGKPNKTGEKVAGNVLKEIDPFPNGTIQLQTGRNCQLPKELQSQNYLLRKLSLKIF